jgi:hypothetical protein
MAIRRSKNIPTYIESGQVHVQSYFSLGKDEKFGLGKALFSILILVNAN